MLKIRKTVHGLILFALFFMITVSSDAASKELILATTTSTQDSGLLDALIPIFEKKTGYFVKTIAVGSGQAMAMGKRGEADVLLVHSPAAEKEFINQGFGVNRKIVMHNDFVILGPSGDPAGIKKTKSAVQAFSLIAGRGDLFLSRGDNSGTHSMEIKIWGKASVNPIGRKWYQETGLGMGQTINVASEKQGYTLADRGTYLSVKKTCALVILSEGDAELKNVYHVIEVNPAKFDRVNNDGAKAFSAFMVSDEAQAIIKKFGVDKYGSPLFFPDANTKE